MEVIRTCNLKSIMEALKGEEGSPPYLRIVKVRVKKGRKTVWYLYALVVEGWKVIYCDLPVRSRELDRAFSDLANRFACPIEEYTVPFFLFRLINAIGGGRA